MSAKFVPSGRVITCAPLTHTGQVRAVTLGTPLERMVVHAFRGERIMAVALDLVAQRADHLRVAEIASLADVDVESREFQWRIGTNAIDLLDRALQVEERNDLDDAADGDRHDDSQNEND